MHRCRECQVILQENRNWHASYAARNYRHCMECARAYSRRRYGRLKPNAKHRKPTAIEGLKPLRTARERAVRDRAAIARARRQDRAEPGR
jgi:hypothetical protein